MGITRQQALDCFASDDLIGVGMEADAVRRQLHPEDVVGYSMVCPIRYAASLQPGAMAKASDAEALQRLFADIDDAVAMGATGIVLREHAAILRDVTGYEQLFSSVKQRFPQLSLQGLRARDLQRLAARAEVSLQEITMCLHGAGLDMLEASETGLAMESWLPVHRAAHDAGMRTIATLVFENGESAQQRVDMLEAVRSLQEQTGGFAAATVQSASAMEEGLVSGLEEPTAVEWLKVIAVSRMLLDQVPHMQSAPLAQGVKVAQMSLRFGGDDVGSAFYDEDRKAKPGIHLPNEEEVRRFIRDAGFQPAQRDALFRMHFL